MFFAGSCCVAFPLVSYGNSTYTMALALYYYFDSYVLIPPFFLVGDLSGEKKEKMFM
jgi:hypothetical protein